MDLKIYLGINIVITLINFIMYMLYSITQVYTHLFCKMRHTTAFSCKTKQIIKLFYLDFCKYI